MKHHSNAKKDGLSMYDDGRIDCRAKTVATFEKEGKENKNTKGTQKEEIH